jgi:hypothetical protein
MADLTVTLSESVVVNGSLRGSTNNLTVTGIEDTFERIVTCPHSNTTTIATFNSNVYGSAGALDLENCKYIRVTNIDTADGVIDLAVVTENTLYTVVMTAGASHLLCQADTAAIGEDDTTTPAFPTLEDITSIQVRPRASANVDVEIFVASV